MHWSVHTWTGSVLAVLFGAFLLARILRRKAVFLDRCFTRFDAWLNLRFTEKARVIFTLVLIGASIFTFVKCYLCESSKTFLERGESYLNIEYFHLFYRYFMRILPMLMGGAFIAGLIERYFRYGRYRLPSSMLGAGVFASLIPICSCSAVPIAHSLLVSRKMTLRAVMTFLLVVPVLNPFVIVFGTSVIGWRYTALRIGAVFGLGMLTGILMERFIGIKEAGPLGMQYYSCKGCSSSRKASVHNPGSSVLLSTYKVFFELLPFMIIGLMLGAAVAKYLPPPFVGKYLSSNILGLFLASVVGLPLFICSGEEVLILKPLLDLGLPMGHAIAFTIAGNGICFASIPVLAPCFGKRATAFITAAFLVGSFAVGFLINLIWR